MQRLYFCLRLLAVALALPAIVVYLVVATLLQPIASIRGAFHIPLRLAMCVGDWIQGVPVGYSYWERYQAAAMLDEIAVHHKE